MPTYTDYVIIVTDFRGFLKGDTLLGSVNFNLQPLEDKCIYHESFDVGDPYILLIFWKQEAHQLNGGAKWNCVQPNWKISAGILHVIDVDIASNHGKLFHS